ncbi:hypothetical protein [Sphingomonas abietis]|uniref:Uncharacterized protein n=1 Tax=Sphingomonas abietis TaxID=3012344 RepID=A0ABY7NNW8_9SPHN|nr:hypothetical protein [Sphingomonas abietis]WBO22333.1 hypothetical protein PBT88_19670 [Sphingomonas abietis]
MGGSGAPRTVEQGAAIAIRLATLDEAVGYQFPWTLIRIFQPLGGKGRSGKAS